MLFRYLLVGGINTVLGYGVFYIFIALNFHYTIAILISTAAGALFNFVTYGVFVYGNIKFKFMWRFAFICFILYLNSILIVYTLMPICNNIYLSNFLALIVNIFLGFHLNRRYTYEKN